jgi:hypothetical protein
VEEAGRERVEGRGGVLKTATRGTPGLPAGAAAVDGVVFALLLALPALAFALAEGMSSSAPPALRRAWAAADEAMEEPLEPFDVRDKPLMSSDRLAALVTAEAARTGVVGPRRSRCVSCRALSRRRSRAGGREGAGAGREA